MKIFNFIANKPINIINNQSKRSIKFTSLPEDTFEKKEEVSKRMLLTKEETKEFRDYLMSLNSSENKNNNGCFIPFLFYKKDEQRFSERIIDDLVKIVKYKDTKDLVTTLCELKNKDGEPVYTDFNILTLVETAQETDLPVFIKELAKLTKTEDESMYTAEELCRITKFAREFNATNFIDYSDMASFFASIFNTKEDFDVLEYLTGSKFRYNGQTIFNFEHVMNLMEVAKTKEGLEAIDFLTKPEFIHNGELVFDPEDMGCLVKGTQFETWQKNVEYLYSEGFLKKLEINTAGKYKDIVMDILRKKLATIYSFYAMKSFDMNEKSFLEGVKKLSTSTFKIAYGSPNQYLSGIDLEYSTPDEKGHFPKLPHDEMISERGRIVILFQNYIEKILRSLQYLDTDTVNQMMDKRTDLFIRQIGQINELNDYNFHMLSKAINCSNFYTGKRLTAKDKIQLCQIIYIFQQEEIDTFPIFEDIEKGTIDFSELKKIIEEKVLKKAGVKQYNGKIFFYKELNEEFGYLSLMKPYTGNTIVGKLTQDCLRCKKSLRQNEREREELISNLKTAKFYLKKESKSYNKRTIKTINEMLYMLKNIDNYTNKQVNDKFIEVMLLLYDQNPDEENDKELFTCIREGIDGVFEYFITDINNKYGKTNLKTQKIFKQQGLNYNKWLSPDIPNVNFDINGKTMRIRMWQRDPLEDLFIGNKTTCCTAIGTGGNAAAAPVFLLNTAFNVVELYDSDGKVVGMSRVFMGKIDNEPALIMDNIELNNTFIKGKSTKQREQIRNNFFDYMNQYAQQITGKKDTQVYFCSHNLYLFCNDLEQVEKPVDFIGAISQQTIYINSADCSWLNPNELSKYGEIKLFKVPKNN